MNKKGLEIMQMVLLILAIVALIFVVGFFISKTGAGKDFFNKLIEGFIGKIKIG